MSLQTSVCYYHTGDSAQIVVWMECPAKNFSLHYYSWEREWSGVNLFLKILNSLNFEPGIENEISCYSINWFPQAFSVLLLYPWANIQRVLFLQQIWPLRSSTAGASVWNIVYSSVFITGFYSETYISW